MTVTPAVSDREVRELHGWLGRNALGRANAVPASRIVAVFGLGRHGDRVLRALAHRATELGLLLCTGNQGYWVPTSMAEVEETLGRMRSQAAEMNERARRLESLAERHFYSTQLPLI